MEDIDLFVGGLAESPGPGAIVGPTFSCIIGAQFKLMMDGDRFFYRHSSGENIKPLEPHCLKALEGRRLSDIICENTDIKELAGDVFKQVSLSYFYIKYSISFKQPGGSNPKTPCKDHKKLDIVGMAKEHLKEMK